MLKYMRVVCAIFLIALLLFRHFLERYVQCSLFFPLPSTSLPPALSLSLPNANGSNVKVRKHLAADLSRRIFRHYPFLKWGCIFSGEACEIL